jgi:hypothetical protein
MYKYKKEYDGHTVALNVKGFPKVVHINQFTSQRKLKALHILKHPGVYFEPKKIEKETKK